MDQMLPAPAFPFLAELAARLRDHCTDNVIAPGPPRRPARQGRWWCHGTSRAGDLDGFMKGTAISGIVSGLRGLLLGLAVVVGGVTLFNQAAEDPTAQDQIDRLVLELERLSVE